MIPAIDPAAIAAHVEMIHGLAGASGAKGNLTVSSAPANGGSMRTERFAIGDAGRMTETIVALARADLNIWAPWVVFRNDLPPGSKGGEADVVAVLALVGDLDADNGKPGRELPLPSPYVLETSRGNYQPVFPLARALTAHDAKPIAVALSDAIGADSRTKDTSGLWRIPGTLNWPTKTKLERGRSPTPQLVTVQTAWTGEMIEPERLWEKVQAFAKGGQRTSGSGTSSGDFSDLPAGLRKLIAGAPYPGEDQSETAASVFAQLRRLGWSDDQIREIVQSHPQGIGKRYADGKDLDADLRRTGDKFGRPDVIDPVDLWARFDPPSLARNLLPDLIERFAVEQAMSMGGDASGVAMAALAVCAAAIPDGIKLQVKRHNQGWTESARLWVALVGPVSSMKSPIMSAAIRPLRKIDADLTRTYQAERSRYDQLSKEAQKQTRPPKQTRLILQDTTIEAAQEIIADSPDGLLCYQDELSGWFGSMDKYSGSRGAAKDRSFWLESYNGQPYAVNRIGRGARFIENLSVSILGGIQPEPIRKLVDDSHDDGLIQRLVPIVVRPAVVGRDEPADEVVTEYAALIGRLHHLNNPMIVPGARPDGALLHFSEGAQVIRQDLERRHLELQSLEAINGKLAAHIGKYNGLFARLCVVWHCIEQQGRELSVCIEEGTARKVARFMQGFLLPHAFAFYAGVIGLSNDHDRLAAVAGYILARRLERLTSRDIQRGDRTMRKLKGADIQSVLDQLEALGWLLRVPAQRPGETPQWHVNPVVHAKFADRAASEATRRERSRSLIGGLLKHDEAVI